MICVHIYVFGGSNKPILAIEREARHAIAFFRATESDRERQRETERDRKRQRERDRERRKETERDRERQRERDR